MKKAKLVAFEGLEGAGLSSILLELPRICPSRTVFTHEPGGTERGVEIKKLIANDIHRDFTPETLFNLYWRDRIYHLEEVIRPALKRGNSVVTKYFVAATWARQIFGLANHGVRLRFIENCEAYLKDVGPIYNILIDVDPEVALQRKQKGGKPQKFVNQNIDLELARKGYLEYFAQCEHGVVIDGNQPKRIVIREVKKVVKAIFKS